MNIKIALVAVCLALAGCSGNAPTQTVEWYKNHEPERGDMLADCRANPGERELTANCVNAQAAQNQLDNARRGLAPLSPLQQGGGR